MKRENIKVVRLAENCRKSSNYIKQSYKYLYNQYVKSKGFKTTNYFTSYFSESYTNLESNSNIVELMIHPIFDDEAIMYDSVEKKNIQFNIESPIGFDSLK